MEDWRLAKEGLNQFNIIMDNYEPKGRRDSG
jgi:hypothetical protein